MLSAPLEKLDKQAYTFACMLPTAAQIFSEESFSHQSNRNDSLEERETQMASECIEHDIAAKKTSSTV